MSWTRLLICFGSFSCAFILTTYIVQHNSHIFGYNFDDVFSWNKTLQDDSLSVPLPQASKLEQIEETEEAKQVLIMRPVIVKCECYFCQPPPEPLVIPVYVNQEEVSPSNEAQSDSQRSDESHESDNNEYENSKSDNDYNKSNSDKSSSEDYESSTSKSDSENKSPSDFSFFSTSDFSAFPEFQKAMLEALEETPHTYNGWTRTYKVIDEGDVIDNDKVTIEGDPINDDKNYDEPATDEPSKSNRKCSSRHSHKRSHHHVNNKGNIDVHENFQSTRTVCNNGHIKTHTYTRTRHNDDVQDQNLYWENEYPQTANAPHQKPGF